MRHFDHLCYITKGARQNIRQNINYTIHTVYESLSFFFVCGRSAIYDHRSISKIIEFLSAQHGTAIFFLPYIQHIILFAAFF
jgi:hypothetical protein